MAPLILDQGFWAHLDDSNFWDTILPVIIGSKQIALFFSTLSQLYAFKWLYFQFIQISLSLEYLFFSKKERAAAALESSARSIEFFFFPCRMTVGIWDMETCRVLR